MKRLSLTILFLGLLWATLSAEAQENGLPVITDENVTEVALYAELENVDEILAQPNSPNLLLEDWVMVSTGKYGLQTAVWNSLTRTVEATLEGGLGLVSPNGDYMMTAEDAGFSLWDLRAYKLLYRYNDPAFFKKMAEMHRYHGQRYSFFHVTETHAYVGGFWRLHVIDLTTGQEVDRTLQWCQMPAEIAEAVKACTDGTGEFSMSTPTTFSPQRMDSIVRREYPASGLAIDPRSESRRTNIYMVSLNDGTEIKVWLQEEGYSSVRDMQLMLDGRVLVMRRGASVLVYAIYGCRVQARRDVNLREGPGQSAQLIGTYGSLHSDNSYLGVIAQSDQSDGVWWQLSSGEWLRSDFAEAHGECDSLPIYVPAKNPT